MITDFLKPSEFRYERKFLITGLSRYEIESFIKMHPAAFSEIFHPRFVNNIYLDTFGMSAYWDNLIGIKDRLKVRIRWYDDLFGLISEPVLELKIKRGLLGGKLRYPLPPFTLDGAYSIEKQQRMFESVDTHPVIGEYLKSLKPALLNRYRRIYFQSADHKFRITIDHGLEYFKIEPSGNLFLVKTAGGEHTVMELKYSENDDDNAASITNFFPVRMTKNSKYVSGIESVCFL